MSRASLRLFDKIGQPSSSSIAVTLSVLLYLLLTNLAALRCTISNFTWLNFWCGSHTVDAWVHKGAYQREVSYLFNFCGQSFRFRLMNNNLALALVVVVVMCLDQSRLSLMVTPKYLESLTSSSTCQESLYE